ncbi:MAG: hypothetical protein J1G05_00190 [Clostridiales bacterium]|nr:hypothetical protein [Clostridiales bacterium]
MAINVSNLEGKEITDDFVRKATPTGRWGYTWSVFKASFLKLILLNIFILISFAPGIAVIMFRNIYVGDILGGAYQFNTSIIHVPVGNITGLTEMLILSADLRFYSLLIVAGFIASLGISGATYCIRKILLTNGQFSIKNFFHGIKVGYFNTLLPVTLFMVMFFMSKIVGDWKNVEYAIGGNKAGAMTAYVFAIIATVLMGIYCAWLYAVGTNYRVKFTQLFKNSFVMLIGTPLQTVFMAAFALIPVWFFLLGGLMQTLSYIMFIFIGFIFVILSWISYSQWAFDLFITPNLKAAQEDLNSKKTPKQLQEEKAEADRQTARALLAAGKSELASKPVMPIEGKCGVARTAVTFRRDDIALADTNREKLKENIANYEKEHINDPVYVEYNKMFQDREKALQDEPKKGKKKKKISSDNLLK